MNKGIITSLAFLVLVGMTKSVRRPTEEEAEEMAREGIGGWYNRYGQIVVKRTGTKEDRKRILAHELGHKFYGSHDFLKAGGLVTWMLLDELIADYYALKRLPGNEATIAHIIGLKNSAINTGHDPAMVAMKEKIAMRKVGYTGPPAGWTI